MPKASFAFKDFSKGGGFGLQAGKYELVACRTTVHQPQANSKTGEQANPFTCVEIDVVKLSDDWKRSGDDVIQHQFAVAFSVEEDGKLKLKARPGRASGPDDENPEDLGKDKDTPQEMVGLEGNCLVIDESFKPWSQSPWGLFIESLEAKAFKPEINAQGYTENYVNMKFSCETKELQKPKNWKKEQPPTALVCTGIQTYPWDVKKDAKGASATPKKEKAGSASTEAAGTKPNGSAAADALTPLFTAAVAKFVEAKKGTKFTRAEFQKAVGMQLMAVKEIGVKSTPGLVKAHIQNDEALVALSMEHGFEVDTESWTVQL